GTEHDDEGGASRFFPVFRYEPAQNAWRNVREMVRDSARELHQARRGSVTAAEFEAFWNKALQQGGWWDANARSAASPTAPVFSKPPALPQYAGSAPEYPYHLVIFPSLSMTDGRGAHLPWLQALPDPISTVVWRTWVEINSKVAKQMGLVEGDIVRVEAPNGKSIEAPVYPHPGVSPEVIGVPAGQGHSTYTSYAKDRGANPLSIIAPLTDAETGGLAWGATRVRVSATGRRMPIPKFEGGAVEARQLPGAPVAPVTRG
ncbi:MAG: molybdopterin dinucleotide binding domain-containing protein, partial [Chloroflexota bacterium]